MICEANPQSGPKAHDGGTYNRECLIAPCHAKCTHSICAHYGVVGLMPGRLKFLPCTLPNNISPGHDAFPITRRSGHVPQV